MTIDPGELLLKKNIEALVRGGQNLTVRWLQEAAPAYPVTEAETRTGEKILIAAGQSQASRHDPAEEGRRWLAAQEAEQVLTPLSPVWLFGLGAVWPVRLLLEKLNHLTVFEPSPAVLKLVLSRYDLVGSLAETRLTLLCPRHLAENQAPPSPGPILLINHPARRREPGQLTNLKKWLNNGYRSLESAAGRPLKIMIVPPLSGGSLPVAESLARAVGSSPHELYFLDWGRDLQDLEKKAQSAPDGQAGRLTAALFEQTASRVKTTAIAHQPDLILALAQAPLDAGGLENVRSACAAPLALWLVEDLRLFSYAASVAPAYDAIFHIQEGLAEAWAGNLGLSRVFYLPLAADVNLFRPLPQTESALDDYRADLSFMGAGYPNRRRVLTGLARDYWPRTGRPAGSFKVFGSGWAGLDPILKKHLFEDGRRVSAVECALIYAGGLVNLNLHSSLAPGVALESESRFVNPRTFELAAAGAFQIVDDRPLLAPLFEDGRELVTFDRAEHLPDLIDHYLARPEEARRIGLAARQKVLDRHQYAHRLKQILLRLGWTVDTGPVKI